MVQQEPLRNTMYENSVKQTNPSFLSFQTTPVQQEVRFQEKSMPLYGNQSLPIHYNVYPSGFQNNNGYQAHNSNHLNQINELQINNNQAANYQPRYNQIQASNYNYQYDLSSYQTSQANKSLVENQNFINGQMNLKPMSVEESDSNDEFVKSK